MRGPALAPLLLVLSISAPALADGPIPAAPGWTLVDSIPHGCWAERNGKDIDTKLMVTNDGGMLVLAGRADWHRSENTVTVGLAIDGGPVESIDANMLPNLVLIGSGDGPHTDRLRAAHTLAWHFPWGDYSAQVDGLGAAFDAAAQCQRNKTHT